MSVVVLGASGQIGSIVYQELKKNSDDEVIGTSRRRGSGLLMLDPFTDDWSVLEKPSVIVNCVGQIQSSKAFSFDRIHIGLTKLLISNRTLLGNPRIIQVSALGASANHKVKFLRTKGEADDYLLKYANTIIVRPSIVCTHRTMLAKKLLMLYKLSKLTGGLLFLPKGFCNRKIQPVMPDDLAVIVRNLAFMETPPNLVNVPGLEEIKYAQLIDLLFKTKRSTYKIIEIPRGVTDRLVKYFINIIAPQLINDQQYELLFSDNVAEKSDAERFLNGSLQSSLNFWKKEFSYANN